MLVTVLKSKIHCARVTEANLNYMGSITIDENLMDAAGMLEGEQVHIVNNNNGERFITYRPVASALWSYFPRLETDYNPFTKKQQK